MTFALILIITRLEYYICFNFDNNEISILHLLRF